MPKEVVDYSNTIIYKIYCKDIANTDIYVGHTTNFIKRKSLHKSECKNLNNKVRIYETIRQNGGWSNWDMIEIAKYNCYDHTEARIKEQEHYELLKANLNVNPPFVYNKKYFCKICDKQYLSKDQFEEHISNKLCMVVEDSKKSPKVAFKFFCKYCDYGTSKKSDYDKHLSTDKHNGSKNGSKMVCEDSEKSPKVANYECECGKIYKYDSGYYRHKKRCSGEIINEKPDETSDKDLIMMLVKQNTELLEVIKNGTHNNNNNSHHTNSHNKTFNLQFFLNETCKDAMNITDFVNSIHLQLSDLEKVGKIGFVEGISNIIVKNLNSLDETKRPVHCTDAKREVIYIKDENKWEKENENKQKIRKVIKKIAHKNSMMLNEFKSKHPDCLKSESKYSGHYNTLTFEAMGGKGDNDLEKEDKIIKNIAKKVILDKEEKA